MKKDNMHPSVHSSAIYNSQDMGVACVHRLINGEKRHGACGQWDMTQP